MTATSATPGPKKHIRPDLIPSRVLKSADKDLRHPIVIAEAERRAASVQLRVADAITSFAGSMRFVYVHVVVFAAWMIFFEKSPWPTLTLVVSLEAIFLSTFVMIGQNRQATFQQAKADRDFNSSEKMLEENTDLTRDIDALTKQIHELTQKIEALVESTSGTAPGTKA